jgi:RNA polymerase-binding transcription factor DksA
MSDLTQQQRELLVSRLHVRAEALHGEIEAALHAAGVPEGVGLPAHLGETGDEAIADLETSLDVAALARDVQELYEVERALRRLRNGEAGVCADCGTAISFARLSAQPTAMRCLSCQEKAELVQPRPRLL